MKKKLLLLMTVLMLALLSSSVTAVSAQPNKPIACVVNLTYDPDVNPNCWLGVVSDCSIAGPIEICEKPARLPGKTEHFFETFTIWPDSGGEINGEDAGVWSFVTFKFRANGWVTSASPEWGDLVGFKLHEMGSTSDPSVMPLTATNVVMTLHQP
jgi:hypothetical protein